MADFYKSAEDAVMNADNINGALVPDSGNNEHIFGAWCSADYLNNQKIINSTAFFTFAPLQYMTYYWTIVRRNLDWYNGFVYGIHNQGILSTRVGAAVCNLCATLTLSGGIRFKGNSEAKKFMTAFARKRKLLPKLKQCLPVHNAIGFTLAKLDVEGNGHLDINFVQGNRYYVQSDNEGNITASYAQIIMLTANPDCINIDKDTRGYYIVEERFYRGNKPCIRYRAYEGPVLATAPLFDNARTNCEKGIPYLALPQHVQAFIMRRFKRDVLNKTFYLPFEDLGEVVLKNSYSATGMDDYTCFADSTLSNAGEAMYEYDLTTTQKEESKYLCQDFAAVPEEMIINTPAGATGDERAAYVSEVAHELNSGINARLVKRIRYIDPTNSTPFIYQVPLKTNDYGMELDRILNKIAMLTHLSPTTLAGYLHNGVEKTAREVTADQDNTRLTIKDKRDLLVDGVNKLTATALKYYGYVNERGIPLDCQVVFNEGALSNPYQEAEIIAFKVEKGLIDPRTAVAQANPDLDEEAVDKMFAEIQAHQAQQQAQPFGGLDNLNLGID